MCEGKYLGNCPDPFISTVSQPDNRAVISIRIAVLSHPCAPAGMSKRGICPHPSGNIVRFLCLSSCSKTLSRRIIYASFSHLSSASGGFAPNA